MTIEKLTGFIVLRKKLRSFHLLKIIISTSLLIVATIPVSIFWWGMDSNQLGKWVLTEYGHSVLLYFGMKLWKRVRPKRFKGLLS